MALPEVPQVSDPSKENNRMRRFTSIVSSILNALLRSGYIVRASDGNFRLAGTSPLTTQGDLFTFSTQDDRLPVGDDGQILSADSAEDTGLKWIDPEGLDPIGAVYPVFTTAGIDDEFDGPSFTGWTAVNPGTHVPALTQVNNSLSLLSAGSDASGEMNAWVKAGLTIAAGNFIQLGLRSWGFDQATNSCGLVFADGSTYNAGAQAVFYESQQEGGVRTQAHTKYNTQGTSNLDAMSFKASRTDTHLRLRYNGANSFTSLVSPDGISWVTVRTQSITVTPTVAGFWVSTQGGTNPYCWSLRYFRFG